MVNPLDDRPDAPPDLSTVTVDEMVGEILDRLAKVGVGAGVILIEMPGEAGSMVMFRRWVGSPSHTWGMLQRAERIARRAIVVQDDRDEHDFIYRGE